MTAFTTTPRKTLTDQKKVKLFQERDGRCHRCDKKIPGGGSWTVAHILALELGGGNNWDNLGVECGDCFSLQNGEDHAAAAKGRRIATKHFLPTIERKRKGRAMPGTRASGIRKRMNGTVEGWE